MNKFYIRHAMTPQCTVTHRLDYMCVHKVAYHKYILLEYIDHWLPICFSIHNLPNVILHQGLMNSEIK